MTTLAALASRDAYGVPTGALLAFARCARAAVSPVGPLPRNRRSLGRRLWAAPAVSVAAAGGSGGLSPLDGGSG